MTFCLGIKVKTGIVALADTRITSGTNTTTSKKITTHQIGKNSLFLMTSGLRSVRDKALTYFEEAISEKEFTYNKMYKAVNAFCEQLRRVASEDKEALKASGLFFDLHALVGGQLADDDTHKLFLLYPQGNWIEIGEATPFAIIGNFPYNISTQIVFKTLEMRDQIPEFAGMFQKEVAERICEKKGSKTYGILSVLAQAFYTTEYLFTVDENVFIPPPKVKSGVMRMTRKEDYSLPCGEKLFFTVVKTAFQQRRKTLRNSLKTLNLSDKLREDTIFDKRPEQLSTAEFIELTQKIEADGVQS